MPAALTESFGASPASPMTKSPPVFVSAKTGKGGDDLAQRDVLDRLSAAGLLPGNPSPSCCRVDCLPYSSTSTAVGPTERLPCTVGVTRARLAHLAMASWKIVCG